MDNSRTILTLFHPNTWGRCRVGRVKIFGSNIKIDSAFLPILIGIAIASCLGCSDETAGLRDLSRRIVGSVGSNKSFHEKMGWVAEEFFTDAKVISLCHAIESEDLELMRQLIDSGADVNAIGEGGMTPLLWAFPDNKIERFKLLLENGADPNVKITGEVGIRASMKPGDSVTIMSARTAFPGYLEAVLKHGGDPNIANRYDHSVLSVVIQSVHVHNRIDRVKMLIDAGADVNARLSGGNPLTIHAISRGSYSYDIVLMLLQNGADYRSPQGTRKPPRRLVHCVVSDEQNVHGFRPEKQNGYYEVVKWLEDHGEDLEQARKEEAARRKAILDPRNAPAYL